MENFDSTVGTRAHIAAVAANLEVVRKELARRAEVHDASKLEGIERECLDAAGPQPRVPYGGEEYAARLALLRPMIDHHMRNNSHHPEFYTNGIYEMDLFDVFEMLCDWMAAAQERDPTGFDIERSIAYASRKHEVSPQLAAILRNTAMRWPAGPGTYWECGGCYGKQDSIPRASCPVCGYSAFQERARGT